MKNPHKKQGILSELTEWGGGNGEYDSVGNGLIGREVEHSAKCSAVLRHCREGFLFAKLVLVHMIRFSTSRDR